MAGADKQHQGRSQTYYSEALAYEVKHLAEARGFEVRVYWVPGGEEVETWRLKVSWEG